MRSTLFLSTVLALLACGGESNLTLNVTVPPANAASALTVAAITSSTEGGKLTLSDGANTLVITEAAVVLREIKFERDDDTAACTTSSPSRGDDDEADGDDGCEEFRTDAMVVSLPLDGSTDQTVAAAVAPGIYDEIELKLHKLGDDPRDAAALAAHPEFDDFSIKVVGTYNGTAFTFFSDVEAEQELELEPPLVIAEGNGDAGVTLAIDLASWFATSEGRLVDPATALHGGSNEELVERNIEGSVEGFEDDDHDGDPDDD